MSNTLVFKLCQQLGRREWRFGIAINVKHFFDKKILEKKSSVQGEGLETFGNHIISRKMQLSSVVLDMNA